mgnify:CR=1 FL=1
MWATRKHSGFTIVELLIVVVVIGILAAIVIVAYNGITSSANDAAVKSDLANIVKRLELQKVEDGSYPYPLTTAMDIHVTKSAYDDVNNLYYCYDSATDTYAVQVRSLSGNFFRVEDGVVLEGTGSSGYWAAGVCGILGITWDGNTNGQFGYNATNDTWASWVQ